MFRNVTFFRFPRALADSLRAMSVDGEVRHLFRTLAGPFRFSTMEG